MQKQKALLFLIISLLLSALTLWGAVRWVNRQIDSRVSHQSVKVVVASLPIQAGENLNAGMLRKIDWPAREPIVGGFSDPALLNNRIVVTPLAMGEPVLESHLAPEGSRAGLSALIGQGKRAMAVHVNDVAGVAGFALPGNLVDVLVSLQDEQSHMISKIVLQDVRVLAVAQDVTLNDDVKAKVVNSVTLEVTPQQAETLDLAKAVGAVSLVLRNQTDKKEVVTAGVRKTALLGNAAVPIAPARTGAKPRKVEGMNPSIEIIRGTVHGSTVPQ